MSWQIVQHAFNMVFGNIVEALKVSALPIGLVLLAAAFMWFALPELYLSTAGSAVWILAGLAVLAMAWIGVNWHRFVLLEEYPGLIPVFRPHRILSYVGWSLVIGAVVAVGGLIVLKVLGQLVSFLGGLGGAVVGMIVATGISYAWLRLAIILPATALGQRMTLAGSWRVTAPMSQEILGIAFILGAINLLASMVLGIIGLAMPIVSVGLQIGLNWVLLMVGISLLTTLYGHLVEGRRLL